MLRWLEANGYDVSYTTGVDTDRRGAGSSSARCFSRSGTTSTGPAHSAPTWRLHAKQASTSRFLAATKYSGRPGGKTSIDHVGDPVPHARLLQGDAREREDRSHPAWTGTWRDARFSPPADGGRPENGLTGTIFTVNGIRNDTIMVPADFATCGSGATRASRPAVGPDRRPDPRQVGYEWDEDRDNGFRPAGLDAALLDECRHIST